ncbi:YcgL domain-containing protein [Cognatilysobacter bugurensis]|uniref:YcgL domain-containing protein GCM10007067_20400 n=1 Tax=Cognatilysobacter bugurensis TaxID=543356 RepID=A0A918T1G7_9GAMM|nr:YcgL domain-containing protein [Lysobacter bugurensis]GHA82361.1 YcgL domain-containing protein [Lysobacter bugurensis]
MHAYVYKSLRKQGAYVFLAEREAFDRVPPPVLEQLGRLEFVLDVELTPGRKLAQANVDTVRENLVSRGFHLQMPPTGAADPMTEDWGTDA